MIRVLCFAAAIFILAMPARAQAPAAQNVQARLIAERETVAPGQTITIALEESINPGWHTYWVNPGDAGAPTMINWDLPPGWQAGPIQWPTPKPIAVAGLMDYGYENKVWLLTDMAVPQDARPDSIVTVKANASWLVCKDICIPEETNLLLQLRVATGPVPPNPARAAEFSQARANLPTASPWPVSYSRKNGLDLFIASPNLSAARPVSVEFFPLTSGLIKGAAPQRLGFADTGIVLRLAPGRRIADLTDALQGVLVLTSSDSSVQAITIDAHPGAVPSADFSEGSQLGLVWALLFAFAGGLILNVMPCVLPVLALKALALTRAGTVEARIEGASYAAGRACQLCGAGARHCGAAAKRRHSGLGLSVAGAGGGGRLCAFDVCHRVESIRCVRA